MWKREKNEFKNTINKLETKKSQWGSTIAIMREYQLHSILRCPKSITIPNKNTKNRMSVPKSIQQSKNKNYLFSLSLFSLKHKPSASQIPIFIIVHSLSLSLSISSTTSHFCHFLHLFHWYWLHCARESPQHLFFHWKLHGVMKSEKIQKSKIYLFAISWEYEHTHCHKIYHNMKNSSVKKEMLFLSQSTLSLSLYLLFSFCMNLMEIASLHSLVQQNVPPKKYKSGSTEIINTKKEIMGSDSKNELWRLVLLGFNERRNQKRKSNAEKEKKEDTHDSILRWPKRFTNPKFNPPKQNVSFPFTKFIHFIKPKSLRHKTSLQKTLL